MARSNTARVLAGLIVVLACAASATASARLGLDPVSTDKCMIATEPAACDNLLACTWCVGAIASGCYPIPAAKVLREKYYSCDKLKPDPKSPAKKAQWAASPAAKCMMHKEADCVPDGCVWCETALGGACFTPQDAKKLPSPLVTCTDTEVFATV